jgi:hypothetical protein
MAASVMAASTCDVSANATQANGAAREGMSPAKPATKVAAAKVTTPATKVTSASAAMSPATSPTTASESLCLYSAQSQSDNRNDNSNLAQHDILHHRRTCVPVFGVAGTLL